jgi:hypothetical protein
MKRRRSKGRKWISGQNLPRLPIMGSGIPSAEQLLAAIMYFALSSFTSLAYRVPFDSS